MSDNLANHFLLGDDVVFLNHGSFGACPRPVFKAYQDFQLELERQPVAFLARELTERMRMPRVALAAEVGTSPDNVVGVTNATFGLNIVAQSLDLKEGDEILTTDHEYASLEKTWAYVARRTGAKIVVVDIPIPLLEESQFTDTIIGAMTDRTKVLFLSHITSPTALYFPIERAVAEARKRGIYSVIDGAHTLGHVPLDMEALGADFYASNCHKWLMAPKGSAFLYARPELQHLLNPLVIGHGWTAESKQPGAKGTFGNSPFIDENEVMGTRDPAPMLAVADAIAFRREHDWDSVARQCQQLAHETAARVQKLTGLTPLSAPQFSAPQMVAMPVPHIAEPPKFQQELMDRYRIEIPVLNWKSHSIVRVSAQGYNSKPQMDLLVEALKEMLDL
ncbi:aminotransferase class V-fold PLP-dependent enzyme [Devosia epidermidihirudinis]|uniref:aminotransferase class V-fold PLP-dependent enzyme n=1 Tax=Devosia epidermidihirudinis TaxID=1293439 RepID=UPI000A913E0D|nr:aminotransferase class V-fold PLP-dependent enzyme [Devosia epidermidihirudinis]